MKAHAILLQPTGKDLVRVSFVGQSHWGRWRRCNIPMFCVKAWVIDFPLPEKAEKFPPIRWEFRLLVSLIGDADGDATYLWSVWRHGSLIFHDFPLPQKAEKVPPIPWEFRLFCSLIQYGMLTAMQHTYDLCEGMGHWFSLAGEGRKSSAYPVRVSFVGWSVSFVRPGCWRRCNIPMICVKAWVIDFPWFSLAAEGRKSSAYPVRVSFVLQSHSVRDADGDATYLWFVWRHGSLIFPCRRRSNCRIATSKGIETETKKKKKNRMIEQGRHMPS